MKNQEQVIQSPSNPVVQKKSNFLIVLLSILLLIAVVIAGYFGWQVQKLTKELLESRNQKLVTSTPKPTYEPGLEPEPMPIEILTKDWKTYTNNELGFVVKYPPSWKVALETGVEPFEKSLLDITDGTYKLQFSTTTGGYGGIVCKFDDSTTDEFAGPGIDNLEASANLIGSFGKELRRNKEAISKLSQYGYQRNSLDYSFRICRIMDNLGTDGKKGYSGTFETKSGVTEIIYYTPINFTNEKLQLLDQILSTFKFTK